MFLLNKVIKYSNLATIFLTLSANLLGGRRERRGREGERERERERERKSSLQKAHQQTLSSQYHLVLLSFNLKFNSQTQYTHISVLNYKIKSNDKEYF